MPKILQKCNSCAEYSMNIDGAQRCCPYCDGVLKTPHPPKFSPHARFRKFLWKQKYKLDID